MTALIRGFCLCLYFSRCERHKRYKRKTFLTQSWFDAPYPVQFA